LAEVTNSRSMAFMKQDTLPRWHRNEMEIDWTPDDGRRRDWAKKSRRPCGQHFV